MFLSLLWMYHQSSKLKCHFRNTSLLCFGTRIITSSNEQLHDLFLRQISIIRDDHIKNEMGEDCSTHGEVRHFGWKG